MSLHFHDHAFTRLKQSCTLGLSVSDHKEIRARLENDFALHGITEIKEDDSVDWTREGVYHPRRRDPKVNQRQRAASRFMEIYREDTSFWTRLIYRFGHPIDEERDTRFTRLADTVARWWAWKIEPGSTSILGRIARLFRVREPLFVMCRPKKEDVEKLRELLSASFASSGITEIENPFGVVRHKVMPHGMPSIYVEEVRMSDGGYEPARLVNDHDEEVNTFGEPVRRDALGQLI